MTKIALCRKCRRVPHGEALVDERPVESSAPTVRLVEGLCPACVAAAKKQAEEEGGAA